MNNKKRIPLFNSQYHLTFSNEILHHTLKHKPEFVSKTTDENIVTGEYTYNSSRFKATLKQTFDISDVEKNITPKLKGKMRDLWGLICSKLATKAIEFDNSLQEIGTTKNPLYGEGAELLTDVLIVNIKPEEVTSKLGIEKRRAYQLIEALQDHLKSITYEDVSSKLKYLKLPFSKFPILDDKVETVNKYAFPFNYHFVRVFVTRIMDKNGQNCFTNYMIEPNFGMNYDSRLYPSFSDLKDDLWYQWIHDKKNDHTHHKDGEWVTIKLETIFSKGYFKVNKRKFKETFIYPLIDNLQLYKESGEIPNKNPCFVWRITGKDDDISLLPQKILDYLQVDEKGYHIEGTASKKVRMKWEDIFKYGVQIAFTFYNLPDDWGDNPLTVAKAKANETLTKQRKAIEKNRRIINSQRKKIAAEST